MSVDTQFLLGLFDEDGGSLYAAALRERRTQYDH